MPLKVKLKSNERFWVNGIPLQNGNRNAEITVHLHACVMTERHAMTENESRQSEAHRLVYKWFLHLTGQEVLREHQLALLALECVKQFPDLSPIVKKQEWFAFYITLLKRIRP